MTASVDYDTVLRCDEDGCAASFRLSSHWDYTRRQAALAGWWYDSWKGDYCPVHGRRKAGR